MTAAFHTRCASRVRARVLPRTAEGAFGYEDLITAIADPKHDDHDQMVTWVGGHFDPDSFDANAVNSLLRGGR